MRTRKTYVLTLFSDPTESEKIAGRLEFVTSGEFVSFVSWDELKTILMENSSAHLNPKNQSWNGAFNQDKGEGGLE